MRLKQLTILRVATILAQKIALSSQFNLSPKMFNKFKLTQWSDGNAIHAKTSTVKEEQLATSARKRRPKKTVTLLSNRENKCVLRKLLK